MSPLARTLPIIAALLLAATEPAAAQRAPAACSPGTAVDTTAWRRVGTGAFTIRLPRAYRRANVHGVDSAVDAWRASRRRQVGSDFGPTRYVGDGSGSDPALVCERGPGDAWMIVAFDHGFDYFARDPAAGDRTLWIRAQSARREDLPELLAIVRSVRWVGRPTLIGTPVIR
jgi:hypothetical protein